MSEMDKATANWQKLTDEMSTYITRLQGRITELTDENHRLLETVQELNKKLGIEPKMSDLLRAAQVNMRNLEVTLKGGKP